MSLRNLAGSWLESNIPAIREDDCLVDACSAAFLSPFGKWKKGRHKQNFKHLFALSYHFKAVTVYFALHYK